MKWIEPMVTPRFLGVQLYKDLSWADHLLYGMKAPKNQNKIGVLWIVSKYLENKSRLGLENGVVVSKNFYIIQIWGSTKRKWISKMQRTQNLAARYMCSAGKRTRVKELLEDCTWLSIL